MGAYLVIGGQVLDMHNDESIQLTRKASDVETLEGAFGDFTRSFELPATDTNNGVFVHYYDIDVVGGYNPHVKVAAELFNDTLPISKGVIELRGVSFENEQPTNYSVVFYGEAKGIASELGEDTLRDLDLSAYNHVVSAANIAASWSGSLLSGNVMYPLIDYHSGSVWGDSGTDVPHNINIFGRGFSTDELRPALKFKTLVAECFRHVGYTLATGLLDRPYFNHLFVLPMEAGGVISDPQYNAKHTATGNEGAVGTLTANNFTALTYSSETDPSNNLDIATGVYTCPMNGQYKFTFNYELANLVTPVSGTAQITFALFVNGTYHSTLDTQTNPIGTGLVDFAGNFSTGDELTIQFNCVDGVDFVDYTWNFYAAPWGVGGQTINMADLMPNMTIKDFVRGVLTTFNAVLKVDGTSVLLDNKTDWYDSATLRDWTEYIDVASATHQKMEVPKRITMQHKDSDVFTNADFKARNGRPFGSIDFEPSVDFASSEIKIETPFSIMVPQVLNRVNDRMLKVADTDLRIYHFLDADNKPAQNDLTLFFADPANTASTDYTYYMGGVLRNSQPICGPYSAHPATSAAYSLAFSLEQDINGAVPVNTLFSEFWATHLARIFSTSSRRVAFKASLPLSEWLTLDLSDTIYIRGRRFKINAIEYDIDTGDAMLDLFTYPNVAWNNPTITGTGDDTAVSLPTDPVDPPAENLIFGDTTRALNLRRFGGAYSVAPYQLDNGQTNTLATQLQTRQLINETRIGSAAMELTARTAVGLTTGSWTTLRYTTASGLNASPFTGNITTGLFTTSRGAFIRVYCSVGWESDRTIEIALMLNGTPLFTKVGLFSQGFIDIDKANAYMAATDQLEVAARLVGGSSPATIDFTKARFEITEQP